MILEVTHTGEWYKKGKERERESLGTDESGFESEAVGLPRAVLIITAALAYVVPEHPKSRRSDLQCAASTKYTPDFESSVQK